MTPVDLYCERCGPGLWAEPLNAVTNAVFLVSALAALRLARAEHRLTPEVRTSIILAVAVAIGSATFHTVATFWAIWCDVVPIGLFQGWFLWLYCRRVVRLSVPASAAIIALLIGGVGVGSLFPHALNGSLGYVPALLILGGLGVWHYRRAMPDRNVLLLATGTLFVALIFRTIDQMVCPVMPIGTHFLWHLLNGGTIYFVMRCMIRALPASAA